MNKSKLVIDFSHVKVVFHEKSNSFLTFFRNSEGGYTPNAAFPNNAMGTVGALTLATDAEAGKFSLMGRGSISENDILDLVNGDKQVAAPKKLIGQS